MLQASETGLYTVLRARDPESITPPGADPDLEAPSRLVGLRGTVATPRQLTYVGEFHCGGTAGSPPGGVLIPMPPVDMMTRLKNASHDGAAASDLLQAASRCLEGGRGVGRDTAPQLQATHAWQVHDQG